MASEVDRKHRWRALFWCGWLYFRCERCLEETAMPGFRAPKRGLRWLKEKPCRD